MNNSKHPNAVDELHEKLHALADGQLDTDKRKEVLQQLENDPELRGELCDVYRIKELVQTAYPLENFEEKAAISSRISGFSFSQAASYLLAFLITLGAGYGIHDYITPESTHDEYHGVSLADIKPQDDKVILFLSSSEPVKFMKTLSKAESLAKKFHNTDGRVYVVTSAAGIDLLRSKTSPHKGHILEMKKLYPSLHFVACNNTLYQYKKAGKPVELIESAEVAPSAVEFVVKHLQRGWRYIAI